MPSSGENKGHAFEMVGDRAKSICVSGIFAWLRAKRRGKKTLKERYRAEADRLKKHGHVIMFAQAFLYNRLGVFPLKQPVMVFQLQFVTQRLDGKVRNK